MESRNFQDMQRWKIHGLLLKTLQVFLWLLQKEKTHGAGEVLEEGRICRKLWWETGRAESCQKLWVHGSRIPPGSRGRMGSGEDRGRVQDEAQLDLGVSGVSEPAKGQPC